MTTEIKIAPITNLAFVPLSDEGGTDDDGMGNDDEEADDMDGLPESGSGDDDDDESANLDVE